nr:MAG TPA: hypothetical protein [Caudoviricetes sp.]
MFGDRSLILYGFIDLRVCPYEHSHHKRHGFP